MSRFRAAQTPVTISISFVHGMLSGVTRRGHAADAWLQRAGISPSLLRQPAARVTADQYTALYRALLRDLADEGTGLFTRSLGRGSMAMILRSALCSATVGEAFRRLTRSFNLLQDDVKISVVRHGAHTGLCVAVPRAFYPQRIYVHEMLMRVMLRISVWLHGERLNALAFDFAIPAPPHAREYPRLFPGVVRFDQPVTALWFETAALARPVRRDEAALRDFLRKAPDLIVEARRGDGSAASKVRDCLGTADPQWPDLPAVARRLHTSVSTLQRHLLEEGTSFRAVKDQLRRDMAVVRLISSDVPVAVLAAELGFSDRAIFQRAFKAWTGSSPGVYRRAAGFSQQ